MIETQHRRLHYLASRRGSKELEIILTRLLKNVLASNPSTNLMIVLENFCVKKMRQLSLTIKQERPFAFINIFLKSKQ